MGYEDWEKSIPKEITEDSVWNLRAYRAGLFLSDFCWQDIQLIIEKKFYSLADQVFAQQALLAQILRKDIPEIPLKRRLVFMELLLDQPVKVKTGILKAGIYWEAIWYFTE